MLRLSNMNVVVPFLGIPQEVALHNVLDVLCVAIVSISNG